MIRVSHALLALPPFSRLPLHLRFFTVESQSYFNQLIRGPLAPSQSSLKRPIKKVQVPVVALPPLSPTVSYILDLGGVAGDTGLRRHSTQGVTEREGPIDVSDEDFRRGPGVWKKWKMLEDGASDALAECDICGASLDITVRGYLLHQRNDDS